MTVPDSSLPTVDVVGVGLNATDTLLPVETFPVRGSKIELHSSNALLGGQVASAMVACQRWGLHTRYVGKLGEDQPAELHRAEFARLGVEAHLLVAPGATSQQAFIIVDSSGERTVLWKRDPQLTLLPAELKPEWIRNARVLHLDGHDTAATAQAAQWALDAGVPVVADLDDLYPGVETLLPNIDFLVTSRDIPTRLTNNPDLRCSLPEVQGRYKNRITAATLGSDGVLAWDGANFHYAPAYRVNVVDTTGAGDIFHAGFIFGLVRGWPIQRQLEFACAAAALNCAAVGARGGIRQVDEIEHLMSHAPRHPSAFNI